MLLSIIGITALSLGTVFLLAWLIAVAIYVVPSLLEDLWPD